MARLPYIDATKLRRYRVPRGSFERQPPYASFSRTGKDPRAYRGPHILLKESTSQNRLTAALVPRDCCFRDTITAIAAPETDLHLLKALTMYLNSRFAAYYLFLTGTTWGVERERVKKNEVFRLPADPLLNADTVRALAGLWDTLSRGAEPAECAAADDAIALALEMSIGRE